MIVEYRENRRTLRGKGANRKYRYTRRVLLKCEKCQQEREVNCTRKIRQSQTHHCKTCIVAELGRKNKGKLAWNKGSVKPIADCNVGKVFINSSGYCEVYVGNAFDKKHRKDKYRLLHQLVAQVKNNSYLPTHSLVHHVDGDKTNNNPNNLFVCESKAIHQDIHTQLEELSMTLVKSGVIQFDHLTGQYYLPQLEEILAAYSVNSEEIYSLQISKTGDMTILSQADSGVMLGSYASTVKKPAPRKSEGATTIPLGSRVQENSKRGES